MRILVCGGRDYNDKDHVFKTLTDLDRKRRIATIIHGDARGADTLAAEWAKFASKQEQPFPANWKQYGRSAGPIRNQKMLDQGKPDLVVAFPGGRGTADMVARARLKGIKVMEVKSV